MSQPEPLPATTRRPDWRLGIAVPAIVLLGEIVPFLLLLLPLPLVVLTDLRGWRTGAGWGLAGVLASVLFRLWAVVGSQPEAALPVALGGSLLPLVMTGMGLVGGLAYRRDQSQVVTFLAPGLFVTTVVLLAWGLGWLLLGVDLVAVAVEGWRVMLAEGLLPSLEAGGASADQIEAWRTNLRAVAEGIRTLFPGGLVVTTGLWSLTVQWLAGRWLQALGRPLRPGRPFVRWRFPWLLAWGYILGQLLLLAVRARVAPASEETLASAGLNLVLVFTYLFFIEGLAVVWFYLAKWGAGKGFRWLVTLFLVTPFFPLVEPVAWLGMLDAWLDFRKLQREGGP